MSLKAAGLVSFDCAKFCFMNFMKDFLYTVKNCCKIYSDLLAILVASKTENLQKFCKSIITIVL